jgi:hypothetical protein
MEEYTMKDILYALEVYGVLNGVEGNKTKAADRLGIKRWKLIELLKTWESDGTTDVCNKATAWIEKYNKGEHQDTLIQEGFAGYVIDIKDCAEVDFDDCCDNTLNGQISNFQVVEELTDEDIAELIRQGGTEGNYDIMSDEELNALGFTSLEVEGE